MSTADRDVSTSLDLRRAVRALLLDDHEHLLLVRYEFPRRTVWGLPGGGLDPGEDHETGLRRELHEELGLTGFDLGPHVWHRLHVIPMTTGHDGQRDQIYLVRTARFDPVPAIGWEAMRAEFVHEIRWWSIDEIEAAAAPADGGTFFAPTRLASLARQLVTDGPPPHPIDTGI